MTNQSKKKKGDKKPKKKYEEEHVNHNNQNLHKENGKPNGKMVEKDIKPKTQKQNSKSASKKSSWSFLGLGNILLLVLLLAAFGGCVYLHCDGDYSVNGLTNKAVPKMAANVLILRDTGVATAYKLAAEAKPMALHAWATVQQMNTSLIKALRDFDWGSVYESLEWMALHVWNQAKVIYGIILNADFSRFVSHLSQFGAASQEAFKSALAFLQGDFLTAVKQGSFEITQYVTQSWQKLMS